MSDVVGIRPKLPTFLARKPDWNQPMPATKLAAMRIAMGVVLLLDVVFLHWPLRHAFFGPGSMGGHQVFADRFLAPKWNWSLLRWLPISADFMIVLWGLAALMLIFGVLPRWGATVAWVIALTLRNENPYLTNSGDNVRMFVLLLLMASPCGATWAFELRKTSDKLRIVFAREDRRVWSWPLGVIGVQLCVMYCVNGVYKLTGDQWRTGNVLHWVMENAAWARFPNFVPDVAAKASSLVVLVWEVGFPFFYLAKRTRNLVLLVGIAFHLGSGVQLELGLFPLYALCTYAVFVPWEKLVAKYAPGALTPA